MKVKVQVAYEVELSDDAYDEFKLEFLKLEDEYGVQYDSEEEIAKNLAIWLISESHVGNYNKWVKEEAPEFLEVEVL